MITTVSFCIGFFTGGMTVALSIRYILTKAPERIAAEIESREG